jgi:hypothetical protein
MQQCWWFVNMERRVQRLRVERLYEENSLKDDGSLSAVLVIAWNQQCHGFVKSLDMPALCRKLDWGEFSISGGET